MISLKSFCETLAPSFGSTPAALYERQRALVRIGALPEPARGRGKGLPATPDTVSMMIIAMMMTDNLADTDNRVLTLANARFDAFTQKKKIGCLLTGAWKFKDALAAILASEEIAGRVAIISVSRRDLAGTISFYRGPRRGVFESSMFGVSGRFPGYNVEASFTGSLAGLARMLNAAELVEVNEQ